MGVGRGIAVTREMFEGGGDAVVLEAFDFLGDHFGDELWVGTERAGADNGIFGVGINVGNGGEIDIKAELFHLLTVGGADFVGFGWIFGGADGGHVAISGYADF